VNGPAAAELEEAMWCVSAVKQLGHTATDGQLWRLWNSEELLWDPIGLISSSSDFARPSRSWEAQAVIETRVTT
jgi:hypothetical protein